jgi:signal transduction histidine kinase/DNA-binding response OmpR family regulator
VGVASDAERAQAARVAGTGEAEPLTDLPAPVTGRQDGERPPAEKPTAWALPIRQQEQRPVGTLVAGLGPLRPFDDDYRAYLTLVAGQIATAIAAASAHEQERRRREELAELDRAKTIFFSNVSHEFRTPLTLILGPLADLLGDASTPPAIREQLELTQRNSRRLLKLVNTLLEFSRIEAGRVEAGFTPTNLAAFTAELASVFRSAIERAGLRFEVNCPPLERLGLPEVVAVDREMWEKIVFNLLSNALKFTFTGFIAVSLRRSADLPRNLELVVHDTGVGIAANELPRLFERFHRVQGTRARTYEGAGIGLALTQELIKLHGGTIGVESAVGEGTTVTVSLPTDAARLPVERLAPAISSAETVAEVAQIAAPFVEEALRWQAGDAQPERAQAGGADAAEVSRPRARVLVADDNADLRDYLRRLLAVSYEVETVADGAAALASARARPPDLALVDVMMPAMDGFALLRALREDSRTRAMPVLLLSARAGEEATIEGLRAGADDYLVKPFSANAVLARVATHLEIARLRAEAETARQHLRDLFMQLCNARASASHRVDQRQVSRALRLARRYGQDRARGVARAGQPGIL